VKLKQKRELMWVVP